uniref:Uncharacterized protein n=1 Tax=Rhizophora mucronata TaxID=61149 RepID=A0A2P2QT30_RHIMU
MYAYIHFKVFGHPSWRKKSSLAANSFYRCINSKHNQIN